MSKIRKTCKYCGLEYEDYDDLESLIKFGSGKCDKCTGLEKIVSFVSDYSSNHSDCVWKNKVHERNMIKDNHQYSNGVTSFTLAEHTTSYRVERRTKRVQGVIDKIIFIREYLYMNLEPIFDILDSIYIKRDAFWNDTGNLIRYVHNCCFQEAVLKLRELLMDGSCKYSVKKICNTLLSDSKYVFKGQEIYERIEFLESKDIMEEKYQPFNIEKFVELITSVLEENKNILDAMKDYRDNRFAHIDELKNENSSKEMSYVNLKRMFSLAKNIYDGFLFAVAPDKYAHIIFDSNIWFSHLNEMSNVYKTHIEEIKKRFKETTRN